MYSMIKALQPSAARASLNQQHSLTSRARRLSAFSASLKQSNVAGSSSAAPPPPPPPSSPPHKSQTLPPPHRRSTGPPSNHKLFYRDIVPPLFRVLAYGSIVFLSLQLVWQYLDGREQKLLEEQVRAEMEAQVRQKLESRGVVKSDSTAETGKSWWSWLRGVS